MIDLIVDALAVHRLERLVTKDGITARPRALAVRLAYARAGDPQARRDRDLFAGQDVLAGRWEDRAHRDGAEAPKLAQLITCPWCTGMWAALVVCAARRFAPDRWSALARALALSSAAALLAGHETPPEPTKIEMEDHR